MFLLNNKRRQQRKQQQQASVEETLATKIKEVKQKCLLQSVGVTKQFIYISLEINEL